jgi:hypothetical protein
MAGDEASFMFIETKPFNPLFEGDVKNEFWDPSCGIFL